MPIRVLDPNLRAGWEPDTPISDTLLRRFLVNWTQGIESYGASLGGQILQRDDLSAVDIGRPSVGGNVATLFAPLFTEDVDEFMAGLNDFYGFGNTAKSGAAYLFSAWLTPDLRSYGWTLVDYQPLMYRPAGGEAPPIPPGLRIEEVHDETSLFAFEIAIVRGFPIDELEGATPGVAFSPALLNDARQRMWVGWEADRPVCAASTFVEAGVNDVILVATIPEARRRGYGASLTWQATLADPTLPSLLIATDDGRPVYERIGYTSLFRFSLWSRDRPTN